MILATKADKYDRKVSTGFHCTNITEDETQRPKEQKIPNITPDLSSTTVMEFGAIVKVILRDNAMS